MLHYLWLIGPVAIVLLLILGIRSSGSAPVVLPAVGGAETLGAMQTPQHSWPLIVPPETDHVPPESGPCAVSVVAIGTDKIMAVKFLRATRLLSGLADAKALSENLPQPLFRDLPAADAERVRRFLAAGGVTVKVEPNSPHQTSLPADASHAPSSVTSPMHGQLDDLERLTQMRQNGVLTDAEFTRMKAEIIGNNGTPT